MPTEDSIVVLYKGGRLPTWHALSKEDQLGAQQDHVDLMLSIRRQYGLMRLEGFRLMTPQETYERFWQIEFPTLEGAEAWIEAEMAPPYGTYGYYEYDLSRQIHPEHCADWVTNPVLPDEPLDSDPQSVPQLAVDSDSVVVFNFERDAPGVSLNASLTDDYVSTMRSVAHDHGLMRLECFRLIAPDGAWHRVWLAQFPTIEGAEAWIDTEVSPNHGRRAERRFTLTRRWAPRYFKSWVRT